MDKPMCPECRNSKRLHFQSFEKGYGRVDSYYPCPKCTEEPVDDRVQEFILDGTGETDPKNVQVRGDLIINFLRTHFKPPTAKEIEWPSDRRHEPLCYCNDCYCKSAVREANRFQKGTKMNNKEYKFKGKRVDTNEWVEGYLSYYSDGCPTITTEKSREVIRIIEGKPLYNVKSVSFEVHPESVEQLNQEPCEPTCQELSVANTQIGNMKRPKVWIEDKIKELKEMFPVGLCPDCGMMGCPRCRLQYSMIVKFKDFLRSCLEDYGKGRE